MDGLLVDSERVTFETLGEMSKENGYIMTKDIYIKLLGITNKQAGVMLKSIYGEDFDYQDCSSANGAILTIHPGETLSLVYRSSTGDEQTIMEDVTFTIEELMTEEQKAKYQKPSYTSTDYHTSSGSHTTSRYVHVEEANNGNCIKTCTDSTDHTAHMYITNVKIPEKSTPGEGADDPV